MYKGNWILFVRCGIKLKSYDYSAAKQFIIYLYFDRTNVLCVRTLKNIGATTVRKRY